MRARLHVHLGLSLLAFAALQCAAACVDGVTPDCSNASVCAPIEGDPPSTAGDAAVEAQAPDTGPAPDAGAGDAAADAATDGG